MKGYSSKQDLCRIVEIFWDLALTLRISFFIDRISTDSNPADWPSRNQLSIGEAAGWKTVPCSWPTALKSSGIWGARSGPGLGCWSLPVREVRFFLCRSEPGKAVRNTGSSPLFGSASAFLFCARRHFDRSAVDCSTPCQSRKSVFTRSALFPVLLISEVMNIHAR